MMSRIPIIAANWKMYKTGSEAKQFIEQLKSLHPTAQVWIAPPFTALSTVAALNSSFVIGAQNMHEAEEGAFTGEISARMLKEAGAKFVILGHSERRRLFHETDGTIHLKVKRAIEHGLIPLLCIGETAEERETGKTEEVLARQLKVALKDISAEKLVVAYEPVWAIGTGKTATPEMAEAAHQFCRSFVSDKTPILYGGSVTPETAPELFKQPNIDGALVGGASLDAQKFYNITRCIS